jgi:hypothetical protein
VKHMHKGGNGVSAGSSGSTLREVTWFAPQNFSQAVRNCCFASHEGRHMDKHDVDEGGVDQWRLAVFRITADMSL